MLNCILFWDYSTLPYLVLIEAVMMPDYLFFKTSTTNAAGFSHAAVFVWKQTRFSTCSFGVIVPLY